MDKTDKSTKQDLLHLIENHATDYTRSLYPKNEGDYFCVVDVNTHNILEITGSDFTENNQEYLGKKCYEVLWGREKPCEECGYSSQKMQYYNISERFNPKRQRDFLQIHQTNMDPETGTYWEFGMDLSNIDNVRKGFINCVSQQNILFAALTAFSQSENMGSALETMLPTLCDFFKCEYGFARSFTDQEILNTYAYNNKPVLPIVPNPNHKDIRQWNRVLAGGRGIFIHNTEDLKDTDPQSYKLLHSRGINSLFITSVFNKDRLIGMIGLGNLAEQPGAQSVMQSLTMAMSNAAVTKELWDRSIRSQHTDPLTGYLNYEGYWQEVAKILEENPDKKYSLWYCDLKKFKFINDVFGYDVGDSLLKYWLELIDEDSRPGETFCRVSADNVSSLRWYNDISELGERFDKAAKKLEEFPVLKKHNFRPELASGIYLIENPEDHLSMGEMLNRANLAQKSIKSTPGSNLAFYTEEMRETEIFKLELSNDAREAMKNEEFHLYFQPQKALDPNNREQLRAEVLVRWHHPTKGLLMPGDFIDLFEQNGIIVDLDHYMFEHTCEFIASLPKEKQDKVTLSVNVSRITALQPNFLHWYKQTKNKYNISGDGLILEFTENGIVKDIEYVADLIVDLQKAGFTCAMDDFGSGQSSLNMLQNLPLNILKLDGDFFKHIQMDSRNEIIVYSILSMARRLNMSTVAEGVELHQQEQQLYTMGCDYIQGYLYAKPMPAASFVSLVMEGDEPVRE